VKLVLRKGEPHIELCRLLKALDLVASGAEGKAVVAEGRVRVDGEVETRKRRKIRPGMRVEFDGKTIYVVDETDSAP